MSEEKKAPAPDLFELKLAAIVGYKIHFIVYLGVNALLLLINLACFSKTVRMPDGDIVKLPFIAYFWVMWPILGWGIGLVIHYMVVKKFGGPLVDSWKIPTIDDVKKLS